MTPITQQEAQASSSLTRHFEPYTTFANSAIDRLSELGISGKGRALFDLLCQYSDKKTHVARIHPTQLSKEINCHKSTVYRHLNSFKEAGLIDFDGEMEVVDKSRGFLRIREIQLLLDGAGYIIKKEQPKPQEKPKENGGVAGMRQNRRIFANLYNRTETTYIHKGYNNNSMQTSHQEQVVVSKYSFSLSQDNATNVATIEQPKSVQNAPSLKTKELEEVPPEPKKQEDEWFSLADSQPVEPVPTIEEKAEEFAEQAHEAKEAALEIEEKIEKIKTRKEELEQEQAEHLNSYPQEPSELRGWHDKCAWYEQAVRAGEVKLEELANEHSKVLNTFRDIADTVQSPQKATFMQKIKVRVRSLQKRHIEALGALAEKFNLDVEALVFSASVQYVEEGYTADRVVNMLKKIGERFSPFRLFEPWKAGRVQLV